MQERDWLDRFIRKVEAELLPGVRIESEDPYEPVTARQIPDPWRCLGTGNYAAVFAHPGFPGAVAKVYAEGKSGLAEEAEVYRRLGVHPAYSRCYRAGPGYVVLKRLNGMTVYECFRRGISVPPGVIRDIDEALEYARSRGLRPHDVHAKNIMIEDGRGKVVDVSDFLKKDECVMWRDFKRIYRYLYAPLVLPWLIPVPEALLDGMRRAYRWWRRKRCG